MQMFKKLPQHRWSVRDYTIGLWLLPVVWIFQSVIRFAGPASIAASLLGILALILHIVCSRHLSRSHPLLKRELRGWGPINSLLRKKTNTDLDEQYRQISDLAYQRAYAILLIVGFIVILTFYILSIVFPHKEIVIGGNILFWNALSIVTGLGWLLWILPVTFMAWQIQEDIAAE